MKTLALAATLAAVLAAPSFAEGVKGTWRTAPNEDGATLDIAMDQCASAPEQVCGKIIAANNGSAEAASLVGKRMVWDMTPDGENAWTKGKIWHPVEDDVYTAKMKLKGDVLVVSGCVLGGLICQGQDWTRVK